MHLFDRIHLHPIVGKADRSFGYCTTMVAGTIALRIRLAFPLFVLSLVCCAALKSRDALAQNSSESISLDSYRCEQFLADAEHPNDAQKLLRTMMTISWAAGYAAAHEAKGPRADKRALELISTALGRICAEDSSDLVTTAFTTAVKHTMEHPARSGESPALDRTKARFVTYKHLDLPGNDLSVVKNATLEACSDSCSNQSECQAYSYDRWNRFCILKRGLSSLTLNPKSFTGVKSGITEPPIASAKIQIERYRGKAFTDAPFRTLEGASLESCEDTCTGEKTCIAYTFISNGSQCRLFDDPGEYFPSRTAESGIKVQKP